jgi:predicted P-loop ATPase
VLPTDASHGEYVRAVGARFLISGVARIYQPGCQVDHVLVQEGAQGGGKTSALRVLGGEWFSESLPADLHSKDCCDHLRGKWVVELAELGQIKRSAVETVKAFISRTYERFRPAYGRNEVIYPRQCIFSGTTNKSAYLPDETGNRRFWPVKVGTIDLESLRRDRDQLWAEAKQRYSAGEKWWLDDDRLIATAAAEQTERYEPDPWEEPIRKYLVDKSQVTVGEILWRAVFVPVERQRKVEQNRVGEILTNLGWVRHKRTASERLWVRNQQKMDHDAR